MSRPHGRARIDPEDPRRTGLCDVCGFLYTFEDLQPTREWAGTLTVPTGFLACPSCYTEPTPFLRTIIIPPDPPPVLDGRLISLNDDSEDFITWEDGTTHVEEDNTTTVTKEGDPSTTGNS